MDFFKENNNDSNQVRLVELADEYVVELPIQQKIQEAIFQLKRKRFDKRLSRWVISKDEKEKLSKSLKPISRITVSKLGNKKYSNPEIELKITSDCDTFNVEIVNYRDFPQMCLALIEVFRQIPSKKYDFETKLWSFNMDHKEQFRTGIQEVAKEKSINVKYNDF